MSESFPIPDNALEKELLTHIKKHTRVSRNVHKEHEKTLSFGDRTADALARVGGSWAFILGFIGFLFIWILINSVVFWVRPYDPFPFIFLNLVLSCLAAIQAPIILMSQNRQAEHDRIQAEHDYQVNLKAELEIQALHDKIDKVLEQLSKQ